MKLKFLSFILFFLITFQLCYSQPGWQKLDPQNTINDNLINIKIFDANNLYIFADSNYIIKSSDGGTTLLKQPWDASTSAVYFKDLNTGFAMKRKNFCKTQNGGASWDTVANLSSLFNGMYYGYSELSFINDNFGYMTIHNGGIQWNERRVFGTSNAGVTWFQIGANAYSSGSSSSYTSESISDFKMLSQSTGYYFKSTSVTSQFGQGPESYAIYKTTNGGANWYNIGANINALKIYSANFINENTGYASVDSSRFFKTTNGGTSWTLKSHFPSNQTKLYMIDDMNGYTISWTEYYRTTDGGVTWNYQNLGFNAPSNYSKISFLNPQLGFIVSLNGLILKTTTGGNVSVLNGNSGVPQEYSLSQNYPNPFNPETIIEYSVPKNTSVKIVLYDLNGREVKELVNEFKQAGIYSVSFNGTNLSSGIYFYKLITNDFVETKKMILVK